MCSEVIHIHLISQVGELLAIEANRIRSMWATKKALLLSMKYWLVHRDPYFMVCWTTPYNWVGFHPLYNPTNPFFFVVAHVCQVHNCCSTLTPNICMTSKERIQPQKKMSRIQIPSQNPWWIHGTIVYSPTFGWMLRYMSVNIPIPWILWVI